VGGVVETYTTFFLNGAEDGGFKAGEREVEGVFGLWVGEGVFFRVAVLGGCGDGGAARVGEAEDFGDFVETFTDGVVQGCADDFEVVVAGHADDLGVAAGNYES